MWERCKSELRNHREYNLGKKKDSDKRQQIAESGISAVYVSKGRVVITEDYYTIEIEKERESGGGQ